MSEITHKDGMPIGWVNRDGQNIPAFICSKTHKPITPERPGTLYWNPDTGDMLVLSDEAEHSCGKRDADAFPYSTEIDLHTLYLFWNSAGIDGSITQDRTREKAKELGTI